MDEYGDEPDVDTDKNVEAPEVESVEEYGEADPPAFPIPVEGADQNPGHGGEA